MHEAYLKVSYLYMTKDVTCEDPICFLLETLILNYTC